jgi:transcriptional/translational regulatory protein YebC/TACO1
MFEKKGQLTIDAAKYDDEDATLEAALEAGAEDFRRDDDEYVVTTDPASFHVVKSALEARGIVPIESEIAMVPKSSVPVTGADVESLLKLIEALEDLDDVQKVWGNFEIDDAEIAKLEG